MPQIATAPRPRKERTENAAQRRAQLLEATRRSIVANGLARTTLATVAAEAGLSQGVAVFYFQSKTGLLTAVLRDQYQRYEDNWQAMLAAAGSDPVEQVMALIRADFTPAICSADSLSLWFAFWGEEKFTPQYAEVSSAFDKVRRAALEAVSARVLAGGDGIAAADLADWIETLTDGYWQKLHLLPETTTPEAAQAAALRLMARLVPGVAERLASG